MRGTATLGDLRRWGAQVELGADHSLHQAMRRDSLDDAEGLAVTADEVSCPGLSCPRSKENGAGNVARVATVDDSLAHGGQHSVAWAVVHRQRRCSRRPLDARAMTWR